MAHTMHATGSKADVIGQLRQQAAQQAAALPSQAEREQVNATLDEAERIVNEYAGDTDSVSISIGGNISQSDTALSISKTFGVSISRGAIAGAPAPTAAGAPAAGAPAPGAPVEPAAGATPATPAPRPNPRI